MTAAEGALELLPIPAVIVGFDGARMVFEMPNRLFRRLGFDASAEQSPLATDLGARIAAFLENDAGREEFTWRTGSAVEQRQFAVTLARVSFRTEPRCFVGLVDQTGEMRTALNLRREMTTDSLTGLPNRGGFGDRLEALIDAGDTSYAVLVIDLDRFNRVNACLGNLAGDELLITVARRIKSALRAGDMLARIGGDEFGILIAVDEAPIEAEQVARRIRAALATPFRLSDFEIRVSASIGIAFGDESIDEPESVIRQAQFAVRRSKQSGEAEPYQPKAFDRAREQFAMETALRRAIEARQLTLHYQPICDLSSGRIVAFESLARWTDDDGREVSPTEFIPVAEESGLIVQLGRWAIDEALGTLAAWDWRAGGDCGVNIAVNLSAIQLQRDAIAPLVDSALRRHGLQGHRLKLELTESALIADPDRIATVLHALKALGTQLAMDDFGTGYSNLGYLQSLPIDVLKIDRSFVTGMLVSRDKVAIVRAVLGLAAALGMETVAEGIETLELGQTLAALGCTYGQGYAYARPLPADEAYALLAERNA
ncbi:bifunctional diguanylate cyclase/phosphodiesterase [Sphingomonas sp. SUN019]|uniref:putative bifunctional diguanylate cyclase/phosphodiesterase n=1 Tax=Sphingomonas sp. SUN019 TaxID=2937788 RepID=UPI0021644EA9|nr:bifunctional diguanylate cyclase/phosphodiesterase [Sphingomonas sp. SUN019]UVO51823.1 bifunctional diguanylate cyclase/phosphodiesterase [Sphingomonas sp. SUN019]